MTPELQLALTALYAAFRRPGQAPLVQGCPCCTTPTEFDNLSSKPLAELTAQDLERYARKAMTTVGHTEAFRYFLPRILELAIDGAFMVEREIVFSKLRYGDWREWPLHEQEAIERVAYSIAATFATTIYDDPRELDEWVCALGQFVDNLPQLLDRLLEESRAAKANIGALVDYNTGQTGAVELANAFWDERTPNRGIFLDWLRRPDVRFAAA